jgi:hypothetical protein
MTNDLGTADQPVTSLAEFLDCLADIDRTDDRYLTFRGHGDAEWDVLPSIMRGKKKLLEH